MLASLLATAAALAPVVGSATASTAPIVVPGSAPTEASISGTPESGAAVTGAAGGPAVPAAVPTAVPTAVSLATGTPIRLMITREINGRTAKVGERFKLRVDEPVYINGTPLVPVGATAWGEITQVKSNGAAGKSGQIAASLLYLDLPNGRVPLRGGYAHKGDNNGAGVVLAVVGFGILGLLNGGDSGRLKAGDTFTGYVDGPPLAADEAMTTPTPAGAVAEGPVRAH